MDISEVLGKMKRFACILVTVMLGKMPSSALPQETCVPSTLESLGDLCLYKESFLPRHVPKEFLTPDSKGTERTSLVAQ